VNDDMTSMASTISGNAELSAFIQNPTTQTAIKKSALTAVFSNVNEVTKSLFRLLSENKRFEILADVAKDYNRQYSEMNNFQTVKVTTAIPMDKKMEEQVLAKVSTFSDKKLILENVVDPSIIGGFILRVGDKQFNASIASELLNLKREFLN
jgi:F-type H+-transporting ATPase subunit delta